MKKITIKDPDSNIKIEVTNEDEMYRVFHFINGWMNLQIDDENYPMRCKENNWISYTKGYFKKKYFNEQLIS